MLTDFLEMFKKGRKRFAFFGERSARVRAEAARAATLGGVFGSLGGILFGPGGEEVGFDVERA
jgi:hypothetical protein